MNKEVLTKEVYNLEGKQSNPQALPCRDHDLCNNHPIQQL